MAIRKPLRVRLAYVLLSHVFLHCRRVDHVSRAFVCAEPFCCSSLAVILRDVQIDLNSIYFNGRSELEDLIAAGLELGHAACRAPIMLEWQSIQLGTAKAREGADVEAWDVACPIYCIVPSLAIVNDVLRLCRLAHPF